MTVVSTLTLVLVAAFLPETRPPNERVAVSVGTVLGGFGELLRHGRFLGLTFIGGLGMASFFSFLASSSFVYIDHFGLTPTQYSLAFSVNAIGFIGSSQFAAALGARHGMARVITGAVSLYALFAVVLFVATAAGFDNLPLLMSLLFITFACLGLVIPSTMVLALEEHGPIAGMASALGGALQMLTGGLMIAVVGLFYNGTALPMVNAIALCAIGALVITLATLGGGRLAHQAAE